MLVKARSPKTRFWGRARRLKPPPTSAQIAEVQEWVELTRRQRQVEWITFFRKEAKRTCIALARRPSNHDELGRITAAFSEMRKDYLPGCPGIFNQRPRRREEDVTSFVVNGAETCHHNSLLWRNGNAQNSFERSGQGFQTRPLIQVDHDLSFSGDL